MKKMFNSKYQMLHLDRANKESMRTTTINVNSNFAAGTNHKIHEFRHGYDYIPQVWGLWEAKYNSFFGGATQRGYGSLISSTGFGPSVSLSYTVDSEWVRVYMHPANPTGTAGYTTAGIELVLTTYVFANDYSAQDYS